MTRSKGSLSPWPTPRLVYHPRYNIHFFGLERLHRFDGRKYGRAWTRLRAEFGRDLDRHWVKPRLPLDQADLLTTHDADYLAKLAQPAFLARVFEVPQLRRLPMWLIDRLLIMPMRWAAAGTVIAAGEALSHGLAVNLAGGYHHASASLGHGFCAYSDVGLAIHSLRATGRLSRQEKVLYIDLDAHQGNGVCRTFMDDRRVFIYDQYNRDQFPHDIKAQRRIDCDVQMGSHTSAEEYLSALRSTLPPFLNSLTIDESVGLAIYNAGSDVLRCDPLGRLDLSAAAVLERDRFVLNELISRSIPTVMVLGGGYTRHSFQIVAGTVSYIVRRWGSAATA